MKRQDAAAWACVALLVILRWHNWQVFPEHQGFDHSGNTRFLRQIFLESRLPQPHEGWADYQPPLYYLLTATLARVLHCADVLAVGRAVSACCSILALGAAFLASRRLLPGREWLVVGLLAALPADVMISAMVYNAAMGALLAAAFVLLLLRAWSGQRLSVGREAALGIVAGLAFMTRVENIVLLGLLAVLAAVRLLSRRASPRDALVAMALSASLALGIASPYLSRNFALYGRPLVINCDADFFPYAYSDADSNMLQLPGFHSIAFFWRLDLAWWEAPQFPSETPSLWTMTYASLVWDHLQFFLPAFPRGVARALLLGGLVPLVLLLLGMWRTLRDWERWWPVHATLLLGLAVYVLLNVRNPTLSSVKASYCFLAFLPGCMLVAEVASGARGQTLMRVFLVAWAALVIWAYWLPA